MITIHTMNLMGTQQPVDFSPAAVPVALLLVGVVVGALAIMLASVRAWRRDTQPVRPRTMPLEPARDTV